jgi:GT2 family glycosyltransferase
LPLERFKTALFFLMEPIPSFPLVSVICLCYNQVRFVKESLESVFSQTHPCFELIVVDDASTDGSQEVIQAFLSRHAPHVRFISNRENLGNCRSFNLALAHSSGTYLIDLAADDLLLPGRIEKQVAFFQTLPPQAGVVFSNTWLINEAGETMGQHFQPGQEVPSGDLYALLLARYLISPPTMMIRREVLEELGGYDESLAYEDFDFWVRSSRNWEYHYLPEITTQKRLHLHSLSRRFQSRHYPTMEQSTLRVCQKAYQLNRTPAEHQALIQRVRYQLWQALLTAQFETTLGYGKLLKELNGLDPLSLVFLYLARLKCNLWPLYRYYLSYKA